MQEARVIAERAGREQEEQERLAEQEKAEVRPDCVVCCASAPSSDASQALRRKEQKRKVEEKKVRPDYVVCCAGATMF